jgi:hypothetical protein
MGGLGKVTNLYHHLYGLVGVTPLEIGSFFGGAGF